MLEITDVVWFDDVPVQPPAPPLSCQLHLWHRWVTTRVDGQTSYVACERCERMATPTIFTPPVP